MVVDPYAWVLRLTIPIASFEEPTTVIDSSALWTWVTFYPYIGVFPAKR